MIVNAVIVDRFPREASVRIRGCRHHRRKECSGWSSPLNGAVVFAVQEITPSGNSQNTSGGILDRQDRALKIAWGRHRHRFSPLSRLFHLLVDLVVLLVSDVGKTRLALNLHKMTFQRPLRNHLEPSIKGRLNAHPLVHCRIVAQGRDRLLAYQIDCIGDPVGIGSLANGEIQFDRPLIFLTSDQMHLPHASKNEITHLFRTRGIIPWGVVIRTLEQTCKHGALADTKVLGSLPEVAPGRSLDPVETTAEINAVQVVLHDLLLGKMILNALCQEHFKEFSAVALLMEVE